MQAILSRWRQEAELLVHLDGEVAVGSSNSELSHNLLVLRTAEYIRQEVSDQHSGVGLALIPLISGLEPSSDMVLPLVERAILTLPSLSRILPVLLKTARLWRMPTPKAV